VELQHEAHVSNISVVYTYISLNHTFLISIKSSSSSKEEEEEEEMSST
jgi:hypothetical protein